METMERTEGREVEDRRPRGSDGVALGIGGVIVGALSLMAVYGEVFADALVFLAVLAGLGLWSLRTPSTRLRWGIAVAMALFVGINLVFAVSDLAHPESPGPFVTTAIVIVFGLATVGLAVAAARRRPLPLAPVFGGAGAVLVLAAIVAAVAAAGVDDDVAQPGDVTVVAEDFDYPEVVEVGADATGLLVENLDAGRHNLVVEGEVDAVELPAGTDTRVALDLEPGEYRFYCSVPGHDGMEGTLRVLG